MLILVSEQESIDFFTAYDIYTDFLKKIGKERKDYPFDDWVGYLVENQLVIADEENKSFNIGRHGKVFVDTVKAAGIDTSKYLN